MLVGPSGSGKSTVLHLLAALEPADGGEIVVDGRHLDAPRRPPQPLPARAGGDRVPAPQPHPAAHGTGERRGGDVLDPPRPAPARRSGRRSCSSASTSSTAPTSIPPRCRAVSASASPWRAALANEPAVLLADEPTGQPRRGLGRDRARAVRRAGRRGDDRPRGEPRRPAEPAGRPARSRSSTAGSPTGGSPSDGVGTPARPRRRAASPSATAAHPVLEDVDLARTPARSSPSRARTARARARSCASAPGCSGPTPGP